MRGFINRLAIAIAMAAVVGAPADAQRIGVGISLGAGSSGSSGAAPAISNVSGTVASGAPTGTAVVTPASTLAGCAWSIANQSNFAQDSATGIVTKIASTITAGTYVPATICSTTAGDQTVSVTRPLSLVVTSTATLVERNIAARGQAPAFTAGVPAGKTRLQYQTVYRIWRNATGVKLHFANKYITGGTGEANGPNPYSLVKCAVWTERQAIAYPVTFGGARNKTVAVGDLDDASDYAGITVQSGDYMWVNCSADVTDATTNSYTYGRAYSIAQLERSPELGWAATSANTVDQVDVAAKMTAPTAFTVAFPIAPVVVTAQVPSTSRALIAAGTSIEAGQLDMPSSDGSNGGGWVNRAAYLSGMPYMNFSLNGMKANDVVAAHTLLAAYIPYNSDAIGFNSTNDVISGSTAAQTIAAYRAVNSYYVAGGITRIYQPNIMPRTATTDQCSSLVGQTQNVTGFAAGGVADTVMATIATQVGSNGVTGLIDIRSAASDTTSDGHLWAGPTYSSTLTASALSTAAVVTVAATPTPLVRNKLVFSPGTANQSTATNFYPYSVTGTGPFTLTGFSALGVAQASGAVVLESAGDCTHPNARISAAQATAASSVIGN